MPKSFNVKLFPFYLACVLLVWTVSGNFFFWDTIQLGAKHAVFYYDSGFSEFFLPDILDSGHIPAFGMYLALVWKVFGKSLHVSHWAMVPFLFGIVYQAYRLLGTYIREKYLYLALILFLADATLLAQSVLVSPDIPLVFFFLFGINAVLQNKRWQIMLAGIGLSLVSMRGMMVVFALGLIDVISSINIFNLKQTLIECLRKAQAYLPAVFLIIAFNLLHYLHKGWFAYHESSPWAGSFEKVDFKGILYNIGLLGWRFIDFGRIFLVITGLVIIVFSFKRLVKDKRAIQLFIIFGVVLLSLSVSFVLYKHLSGHRYLLPALLCFSLLVLYLLFEHLRNNKLKYFLWTVLLLGLISGNFVVYPAHVAQGWDASLAHLPYYDLRNEFNEYFNEENIRIEDVGCTFPNNTELKYIDLNDSTVKHASLDLDNNLYVLYSNVYNDFGDAEVQRLEAGKEFILQKELKKGGVFIKLYKKIQ